MSRFGMLDLACRRIMQRPARWMLAGVALMALTFMSSTVMLLLTGIERTATRVVDAGPALVASRVDAGGWAAIPAADAPLLEAIPGVEKVTPRVWGVLPGPPAVTLLADAQLDEGAPRAIVGSGVGPTRAGDTLTLRGLDGATLDVPVHEVLAVDADILAFDLVLVPTNTARRLLLLEDGVATDFAIDTARDEENDVLVNEVAKSLGYPVRVTTREQMRGAYRMELSCRGGLGVVVQLPAILAVMLLVVAAASGGPGARQEVGKLKMLGWTTGDVLRLHALQMGLVSWVAVGIGLVSAYAVVHPLRGTAVVAPLLGFDDVPPKLQLDPEGAIIVLVTVGACALLPCIMAAFVPALRLAREDPIALLEAP